ncbi:hypothetical protein ACWCO0_17995 [Streptomyces tubercidicus]|uniref:Uncharacterized protein n=1 Tax=Streptomyces tubercidicus TaxID=47759 RepID=A0A640UWT1_9ACTN|nr:hypothetical protein [Streptomyces tubercidicus]WAU14114.1 hypothetical protein STRTU_004693 [Streptomyces tubercidicus]GFE39810.1 hypothetical protein Stube_44830 [Streptomyces tubercidicus]
MRPRLNSLLAQARWAQRVFVIAFALLPVLIVTLASVPALIILPFLRSRSAHALTMTRQLAAWTRALLISSRER